MPHVEHSTTVPPLLENIGNVDSTSLASTDDILVYTDGEWEHLPGRAVPTPSAQFVHLGLQAGPVGAWTPLTRTFRLTDGLGTMENPADYPSTNIIGSWTPVALPTTHLDVDDASAFDTTRTHNYIQVAIPGSASTVCRVSSISIGGGAGGSDRINLVNAGLFGAGHYGVGTPAAGAEVKQVEIDIYFQDETPTQRFLMALVGSLEAISGGIIGWRLRASDVAAFYTPGANNRRASFNLAEDALTFSYPVALGAEGTSWWLEFYSDTAGGTAGQVRIDPIGFLGPGFNAVAFGKNTYA